MIKTITPVMVVIFLELVKIYIGSLILGIIADGSSMFLLHWLIVIMRHITTWLRLEICTRCNAWDKYKSRVPCVMLGTSISLLCQVLCLGQV